MERGVESLAAKEIQHGNLASRIINIDGKVVGNEGLLRKAMRNVNMAAPGTFVTPVYGDNSTKTPCEKRTSPKAVRLIEMQNSEVVDGANVAIPLTAVEEVLENGPWLIRLVPIFLNIWTPNTRLSKEAITNAPIWVKLHNVPPVWHISELGTLYALDSPELGSPINFLLEFSVRRVCCWLLIHLLQRLLIFLEIVDVKYEWEPPPPLLVIRVRFFDHMDDDFLDNLRLLLVPVGMYEADYKVDDDDVEEVFVEKPRVLNSKQTKELQKGASTPVTKVRLLLICYEEFPGYVLKIYEVTNVIALV
ncbi:zinc knuckle CX2CX4HX4C containing protein [Tanacetum coccineum]